MGVILWTTPPYIGSTADSKIFKSYYYSLMAFTEVAYWLAYSLISVEKLWRAFFCIKKLQGMVWNSQSVFSQGISKTCETILFTI